jgi:multiple sugar transport system permease protein
MTPALPAGRRAAGRRRELFWAAVFLGPSLLIFTVFFLYPLLLVLIRSLQSGRLSDTTWVGLANYAEIVGDGRFWEPVWNTVVYTAVVVGLGLVLSIGLAALIFPFGPRLQAIFKGALYLPAVVSAVVITLVWGWLYQPTFGLLNYFVELLGGQPIAWLGDTATAMPAMMVMAIATGRGVGVVLITASMAAIPPELHEAARIDGAGRRVEFTRITLPLIKPVVLYLTLISVIEAFQVFTPIYLLTNGGPEGSTETVAFVIYRTAFNAFDLGMAAAQSVVLLVILLPVSYACFRVFGRDVEF